MQGAKPHFPSQVGIDSYGQGGFRFADMSHRGSLLCLPSGIWAWGVRAADEIDEGALQLLFAEAGAIHFLLLGTGDKSWQMPAPLRARLRELHIGLELLLTGAAVRTYNIVLAERRRVAAALLAVD
jgi:uncharacterized protein